MFSSIPFLPYLWTCSFLAALHASSADSEDGSAGKRISSAGDTGDAGLIPQSGRSPGEGNGNPLQYCCLWNPMDRGAWLATVHGIAKRQTRLSTKHIMSLGNLSQAIQGPDLSPFHSPGPNFLRNSRKMRHNADHDCVVLETQWQDKWRNFQFWQNVQMGLWN